MPFVGYAAWAGLISLWAGAVAGILGATAGSLLVYWLARTFRSRRVGRLVNRYQARLERSGLHIPLKYAVFVSRFIPGLRTAMSVPAGLERMPVKSYTAYLLAGNVIWISLLTGLGYLANVGYQAVQSSAYKIAAVICALVAGFIAGRVVQLRRRSKMPASI